MAMFVAGQKRPTMRAADTFASLSAGCVGFCGTLRGQAFFWLRVFPALKPRPCPPTRSLRKPLGA